VLIVLCRKETNPENGVAEHVRLEDIDSDTVEEVFRADVLRSPWNPEDRWIITSSGSDTLL